jgi:hypothetical protein
MGPITERMHDSIWLSPSGPLRAGGERAPSSSLASMNRAGAPAPARDVGGLYICLIACLVSTGG